MRMRGIFLCLLLICLCGADGCAVVTGPSELTNPEPVYLVEYAVHSDLVMKRGAVWVGFSIGDWSYAALHHTGPHNVIGALLFSTAASFERRTERADPVTGAPDLHDNVQHFYRLYASHDKVEKRFAELEDRFADDLREDPVHGFVANADHTRLYVKDSIHYGVLDDCNALTAETLRALGFHVYGFVVGSHFIVWASQNPPTTQPNRTAADSP
jgi:pimeloyl-ACP methyl ester carboxylesterase